MLNEYLLSKAASQPDTEPLSIRKNFLWNSIGSVFYQGCMWGITVLVVIISGYEASGILAYAIALGNMFFALALFNMRTYQVSDVGGEYTQRDYVGFRFITMGGAAIVMVVYLIITTSTDALLIATLCMFLFKADESLSAVFYGVEQRNSRMDYIGKSQIIRGCIVILSFPSILFFTNNLDLAIITMAVLCFMVTMLYDRRKAALMANVRPQFSLFKARTLFVRCLPAAIALVLYGAVVSVARQIFEWNSGAELLGIYAAIATPTVLIQVLASYLYSPFIVSIAEAWNEGDYRELLKIIGKIIIGIIFLLIALVILAVLFGDVLLRAVFGESIAAYTSILIPTIFATTSAALMALFLDIMISFRSLHIALVANVIAMAVVIVFGYGLMDSYGMNGINIVIMVAFATGILIGMILFFFNLGRK